MKKINLMKSIVLAALTAMLLVSCGDKKSETKEEIELEKKVEEASTKKESLKVAVDAELAKNILKGYFAIKDALVATDGDAASAAAGVLLATLEGQSMFLTKVKMDVEHIAEMQEVEHQREHFETLSATVYKMVKDNKVSEETLYYQYCPMAFDNKGAAWLSAEEEVNNPYFGDKMLHCGMVKEKI